MEHKYNNEKYKIKVNRIPTETEKVYPYNKYPKTNSLNLRKIPGKNSILCKLKFNPEIIINEYHQTSNNINTNINIKTNPSDNSNILYTSVNNNNNSNRPKNFSTKRIYAEYPIESSLKSEDNESNNNYSYTDKSFNKEKNNRFCYNVSNKFYNNENNSRIFSPLSNNDYSTRSKINEYKKRNLNYLKNNDSNEKNIKSSNFLFQSPKEEFNKNRKIQVNNNYNIIDTDNNYNFNFDKNSARYRKNNSQEEVKSNNGFKYAKRKNPSYNIINIYNKTNPSSSLTSLSKRESLRTKKMKEMNDIVFSSGKKLNNIFRNKFNKKVGNLVVHNSNDNNNDVSKEVLNIKLEFYRIKLFKEFFKHFKTFYISYLKKIFTFFWKNLKNIKISHRNDYIYSKKNYLRTFNDTLDNCKSKKQNILDINNSHGKNLIEIFKSSTMSDYYKLYKQFKKNSNLDDPELKIIMNSYSLSKEKTKKYNNQNRNNIKTPTISQYYLNSAPRLYKSLHNLSIKRSPETKLLFSSSSKSPSFRIGNKTIINKDISFGTEGNEKELYRDTKELNKKYEQIQRRKNKSKINNRDMSWDTNANKSSDIDSIKNSKEYSQFNKLRKFIQNLKNNNIKKNILNIERNNKSVAPLNSLESEHNTTENDNLDNNEESNNNSINKSVYNKTFYNYRLKKTPFNKTKNKNINIKINHEINNEINKVLRKKNVKNASINNKKKSTNINTINKNIISVKPKSNNNINNNEEDKEYKKVKVNINKKLFSNSENNNSESNTNQINKVVKDFNYTYNYRALPSDSKLNNSPKVNNNKYYVKRNKINDDNDNNDDINNNDDNYNKEDNSFASSLIKNISTKDKRIHINIFYYTYSNNKYPKKKRHRFYNLKKVNKTSICLIGEYDLIKINLFNFKNKLSSIKEEELSNQNSKIYDENSTLGNNNIYNNMKNNIKYPNELLYSKFVDLINQIFKKYFMKRIKKLKAKKNEIKKEEDNNDEKNINNKIYNKRNRYRRYIGLKEEN